MDIMLAISLAGHDKGHVYYVTKADDSFIYLANGTTRFLSNPKKKKLKHVQLVKRFPKSLLDIISDETELDDLKIKRIIKCFNRRMTNV